MKGIQVCSNEVPRHLPWGDYYKIAKLYRRKLKIFSRTTGPILTKLGKKHLWLKGTHGFTNKDYSQKGDIVELFLIMEANVRGFFQKVSSSWGPLFSG